MPGFAASGGVKTVPRASTLPWHTSCCSRHPDSGPFPTNHRSVSEAQLSGACHLCTQSPSKRKRWQWSKWSLGELGAWWTWLELMDAMWQHWSLFCQRFRQDSFRSWSSSRLKTAQEAGSQNYPATISKKAIIIELRSQSKSSHFQGPDYVYRKPLPCVPRHCLPDVPSSHLQGKESILSSNYPSSRIVELFEMAWLSCQPQIAV